MITLASASSDIQLVMTSTRRALRSVAALASGWPRCTAAADDAASGIAARKLHRFDAGH
jgi:hypothetical protein